MKLQHWQARKINKALQPAVGYLCRLRERTEKVGFLDNDPLFQLVKQSYDNLQALYMKLHYLSCESGVGIFAHGNKFQKKLKKVVDSPIVFNQ